MLNLDGSVRGILALAIVGLLLFLFIRWYKKFKFPKTNCIALVTGGVKSGKTTFALGLALSTYKKELLSWKIRKVFCTLFHKDIAEKPLLYSNIPLSVPYVPITQSLLLRETRPAYRSVFLINEASLVADSQLFKDADINERLMFFNKLFGHETMGGHLIYDTQCIQDLHYSIKRCLSEYFYIHHIETRISFFTNTTINKERNSSFNMVNIKILT